MDCFIHAFVNPLYFLFCVMLSRLFNFESIGQVTISHVMPQTTVSNRKTSTISDTKTTKTDRHHSLAAGARGALASSGDGTSQVTISSLTSSSTLKFDLAVKLRLSDDVTDHKLIIYMLLLL